MDRAAALKEITNYQITLPTDPGISGIDTLFKLSSVITSYRDRVGTVLGEAIEELKDAEKKMKHAESAYKFKRSQYLNQDTIKILKSADLRDAAIDVILVAEKNAVLAAEYDFMDAEAFKERVRLKYEDLKDELRTIKRQLESVNFLYALGTITPASGAAAPSDKKIRIGVGDE